MTLRIHHHLVMASVYSRLATVQVFNSTTQKIKAMKRNQSTALVHYFSSSLRLSLAFGLVGVFASIGSAGGVSKDTYYVNDHLASTVATSDAAGEIAQIEADAFGTQTGAVAKDSRFTGKPYDADMGAYVFPFRNYRPEEARWMSADPSGFPDGQNNRQYGPIANQGLDPLGLMSVSTSSPTLNYNTTYGGYSYSVTAVTPVHISSSSFNLSAAGDGWSQVLASDISGSLSFGTYAAAQVDTGRFGMNVGATYSGATPTSRYRWIQITNDTLVNSWSFDVNSSSQPSPFYPLAAGTSNSYSFEDHPGILGSAVPSSGSFTWTARLFLVNENASTNTLTIYDGATYGYTVHSTE